MKTDVTKNYLLKAEHDLGTAELTYNTRPEYTDTVTFHSQQAVEKALKAYLNFHKEKINTKHDISALLKKCTEIDSSFSVFIVASTANLNDIGMSVRYDDIENDPTKEEAFRYLELAREIREFVLKKLSEKGYSF